MAPFQGVDTGSIPVECILFFFTVLNTVKKNILIECQKEVEQESANQKRYAEKKL